MLNCNLSFKLLIKYIIKVSLNSKSIHLKDLAALVRQIHLLDNLLIQTFLILL